MVAVCPLISVITSPCRRPAFAAGPPDTTPATNSPPFRPACAAASAGIGTVCTPKYECDTRPVEMISSEIVLARLTGIAKPSPTLPAEDPPSEVGTVAPADGTPMRSPEQFTSAPPLLPGLIAASVCSADTSSAERSSSAGTSTVRSIALMMPEVTVPDSPSGAPIATTGWPT